MKKLLIFLPVFLLIAPSDLRGAQKTYKMNFKDANLEDIVKIISDITGKSFIVDQKVRGKITVISPREVTEEEAYRIFLSILEVNNLTVAPVGNIYKIVPSREAKQANIRISAGRTFPPETDEFEIRLVSLRYVDAGTMANIVRNIISASGNVQQYDPTNTLIIADTRANIRKIMKIIEQLDTETTGEVIEIIPVEYVDVEKIAGTLREIFGTQQKTAPRPRGKVKDGEALNTGGISKIISYLPTNSLIVMGAPEAIEALKLIVKELDVPLPAGEGLVKVYYLEYAEAEALAGTLNSILTGYSKIAKGDKSPPQPTTQLKETEFAITADKVTNSLIIFASPQMMKEIINLIKKLDIPRKQVYVEAAIVEVSLNKLKEWGLQYHAGKTFGEDVGALFGWEPGGVKTVVLDPQQLLALSGLFAAGLGKSVELNVGGTKVEVPAFGLFLRVLQSESDVNVLSTPHILTMDTEEATITVAQNVPFPTGQAVGAGGVTTQTIQRQDVGITLKITPRITEADSVVLKIYTEVSNVSQGPQGLDVNVLGVTTFKRSSQTVVLVKDSYTVAIGGLMRDSVTATEQKVPLLGDIPILGWFFRSRQKTIEKTNLLIFLTPHIIRTYEDLFQLTQEKVEEGIKFREMYTGEAEQFRKRFLKGPPARKREEITEEEEKKLEEKLEEQLPPPSPPPSYPEEFTPPSYPQELTPPFPETLTETPPVQEFPSEVTPEE